MYSAFCSAQRSINQFDRQQGLTVLKHIVWCHICLTGYVIKCNPFNPKKQYFKSHKNQSSMYIYFVRYFKCNISAFCIFKESNNLLAWSERTKLFSSLWLGLLNLRALSFYEAPIAKKIVKLARTLMGVSSGEFALDVGLIQLQKKVCFFVWFGFKQCVTRWQNAKSFSKLRDFTLKTWVVCQPIAQSKLIPNAILYYGNFFSIDFRVWTVRILQFSAVFTNSYLRNFYSEVYLKIVNKLFQKNKPILTYEAKPRAIRFDESTFLTILLFFELKLN